MVAAQSDDFTIDAQRKKPHVSAFISFILPGSGQLYNGEYNRGLVMLFFALIFIGSNIYLELMYRQEYVMMLKVENDVMAAMTFASGKVPYRFVPFVAYALLAIFSAIDAHRFLAHLIRLGIYDIEATPVPETERIDSLYDDIFDDDIDL